jgi:hypothetical protein
LSACTVQRRWYAVEADPSIPLKANIKELLLHTGHTVCKNIITRNFKTAIDDAVQYDPV